MSTGSNEGVVDVLDEEWSAITALGAELGEAEWELPSECPGWSVRDLVSHLIGIERTLLGEPAPEGPARLPAHVRNEVGAHNEAWVASRRHLPGRAVLEEFGAVTARRLEELRSFPASRFDEVGPSPVGEVPYGEFMRVRVMDSWVHEQDMRVATGRPGHESGPAADLSMGRLCSAMPFVVAKQAGAPEGASVRFDIRGDAPRRVDVVVTGGRGRTVAALDEGPTVVLGMAAGGFRRLACGRVTGQAARSVGLVEVGGDADLGRRVLDAMAFMI